MHEPSHAPGLFLWELRDPKQPEHVELYLYGTMHINNATEGRLSPVTRDALQRSDRLVLELLPESPEKTTQSKLFETLAYLPKSESLQTALAPETFHHLERTLQKIDISQEERKRILTMRPWFAALTLTQLGLEERGSHASYGSESQLLRLAGQQKKLLGALETFAEQIQILASGSHDFQEYQLIETLQELEGEHPEQDGLDRIQEIYRLGDLAALTLYAEELSQEPQSHDFFSELVIQRNHRMRSKIQALLKNQEREFIAVGALHMVGPDGLLKLLQNDGYQIRRVPNKSTDGSIRSER